jgi:outer membrane protein assembly factor BamB
LWLVFAAVAGVAESGPDEGDWPGWRNDAARSAVSSRALPASLHLRWTRRLETPAPAWPASQHKIRMDAAYEPVVAGGKLFVGSMTADRVTAYDTDSGRELWRFYTGGPVRFAPLVWKGNVYAGSDDGFLYCLDAETGRCRWSVRGGPDGRLVLGNERLISMWPVRGAPVLWEEEAAATLYFAAGIWPFMGVYIYAVDAQSGAVRWVNSGSGSAYVLQQHSSPAFAGVAPQGYLAATRDVLLVPGGRTPPAAYDRRTGRFLYFNVSSRAFGKDAGGYGVSAAGEVFQNHGGLYTLTNGESLLHLSDRKKLPGLSAQALGGEAVVLTEAGLDLYGLTPDRAEETVTDRSGKQKTQVRLSLPLRQSYTLEQPLKTFHARAGDRLYGSATGGLVGAVDVGAAGAFLSWTGRVSGEVRTLVPGGGKLFVSTADGSVFCFGDKPAEAPAVHEAPAAARAAPAAAPGGIALVWGTGEGTWERLVDLAREHRVVAVEPDAGRAGALRRRLDEAGLYGSRVQVLCGRPEELAFPPYLATRLEFGALPAEGGGLGAEFVRRAFQCLRPYGGVAVAEGSAAPAFEKAAAAAGLAGARLVSGARGVELRREGPLAGSAPWTHQYGDPANTVMSPDDLVKPPLGLLWFGGPSNDDILPRHGHGPSPQVAGGRLFIEGPDALRAVDVYTGRLLWQRELPGLGRYYDNTDHQPGAGEIGGNYVSLADGVYVVHDRVCLRLDPATGATVSTFTLPGGDGGEAPHWGYVAVYGDLLLAGASPLSIRDSGKKDAPPAVQRNAPYASASESLVVMDRHSGKVLWQRRADQVFRHNAIAAGGGLIFCIDALSKTSQELLKRRGEAPASPARLLALEARTGAVRWQADTQVFGTWLGYSEAHDILLESGSPARDRAKDEAKSLMAAYEGKTGTRRWREKFAYAGTPILHGEVIYVEGQAVELLTGNRLRRENPLTGQPADWSYARNYGCNTPIAGKHMLLFRSAAAGYYDLAADAGTGNWGGFKSGCTANLIPADGVLNAPDYTRTCTCSYQNQCSLALVPMADVESWTFQGYDKLNGRLVRAGFNFGAPGDWPAPDGVVWLEYPRVGGKGPDVAVEVQGDVRYFRHHAMEIAGGSGQVTASGLEGACAIKIGLRGESERPHTVRLFFAEPGDAAAGARLFDVSLQGAGVLTNLDVSGEAGGSRRSLVKTIQGVPASSNLVVELKAAAGSVRPPLLCGVEVTQEQALRARLRLPAGGPAAPGFVPALLDVSNQTERAVTAELEAVVDGSRLFLKPISIPARGVGTEVLAVPAAWVNAGKRLGVNVDFGASAGRFRRADETLPLEMQQPMVVDVACTEPARAFILARNRRMDISLTGRLSASMDGSVLLETPFELAPGGMAEWECPLPPGLAGKSAEMVLVATWGRDESPVPGRYIAGLDLREGGAKPAEAKEED